VKRILLLVFLIYSNLYGANHYISAAGNNTTGADWATAWTSFPASAANWVRGDTYYIAGGSYGDATIPSKTGTDSITIKRATPVDHGTDTGWVSSYGTDQVVFNGKILISSSYTSLDGITGSDNSGYGIKIVIQGTAWDTNIGIRYSAGCDNGTLSHIEIEGFGMKLGYDQRGVQTGNSSGASGYHWSYIYVHDIGTNGFTLSGITAGNTIIEYCRVERASNRAGQIPDDPHGQAFQLTVSPQSGIIIRYNTLIDCGGSAYVAMLGATGFTYDNILIYGNIFTSTDRTDFCVSPGALYGHETNTVTNVKWDNNTFYNTCNPQVYIDNTNPTSGNESKNNIYVNCNWASVGYDATTTRSNNFFYGNIGSRLPTGETNQVNGTSDPFVSAPTNFNLKTGSGAIGIGLNLGSPYDIDYLGLTRTVPWDAGAYKYVSGGPAAKGSRGRARR
jgi:hypothetical protein